VLSRPTIDEVIAYRREVTEAMTRLIADCERCAPFVVAIETGIHHEQQHQELLLTDVKHMLSCNPLFPSYRDGAAPAADGVVPPLAWVEFDEGLQWIGDEGARFTYDNERPRHRVFVHGFAIASRPVTCGEYLAFMADRGYDNPALWLSDGWARVQADGWRCPLYWHRVDEQWQVFTLGGLRRIEPAEPVCHLSYYEADAYARWAGARLPTEAEWEVAAGTVDVAGRFVESQRFHPEPCAETGDAALSQMFGDVWEWTASPYVAYPGYKPPEGPLGEYNGKFMCNQMVLRGGSCATPASHIRRSYRNFFYPHCRWQFAGLRLARDC
jgi:ergothioneine biosynthesis protein EgtB